MAHETRRVEAGSRLVSSLRASCRDGWFAHGHAPRAVERTGVPANDLERRGHDAMIVAAHMPAAMLFIHPEASVITG
jgi:hypothetical protein